jgi:hypothetical protein
MALRFTNPRALLRCAAAGNGAIGERTPERAGSDAIQQAPVLRVGIAAPMPFFPFAGWKSSFFGDLHAHGKDAAALYTEQKVIMRRWF